MQYWQRHSTLKIGTFLQISHGFFAKFEQLFDQLRHLRTWWNSHSSKVCMCPIHPPNIKSIGQEVTASRHFKNWRFCTTYPWSCHSVQNSHTIQSWLKDLWTSPSSRQGTPVFSVSCVVLWRISSLGVDSAHKGFGLPRQVLHCCKVLCLLLNPQQKAVNFKSHFHSLLLLWFGQTWCNLKALDLSFPKLFSISF